MRNRAPSLKILCALLLLALTACGSGPAQSPQPALATPERGGGGPTASSTTGGAPAAASTPGGAQAPASLAPPAPTLASAPAVAPAPTAARTIADLGFCPDTNGFNFQNYTNAKGYQNLTVDEMQRIFGEEVCASRAGGK